MSSKAAAIRFFSDNVGRVVDTVQARPNGTRWESGPRTVARKSARAFTLDGSTVEFTSNHRVTSVTDTSVTVEWRTSADDHDSEQVIHTTTYTLVPSP